MLLTDFAGDDGFGEVEYVLWVRQGGFFLVGFWIEAPNPWAFGFAHGWSENQYSEVLQTLGFGVNVVDSQSGKVNLVDP